MLSSFKQFICTPVCINCGSFFCGRSLFCDLCFQNAICERIVGPGEEESPYGGRHQYLFEWNKNDPEYISQLVYRLKSNNSVQALRYYGALLAPRLLEAAQGRGFRGIVPIPSANVRSVHARILAQYLAEQLRLPLFDVLQKRGEVAQKTLSATERTQQRIELGPQSGEEFTDWSVRRQKYIFVDDILTTGESFKQAAAALTDSRSCIIATLFYRTRKDGSLF